MPEYIERYNALTQQIMDATRNKTEFMQEFREFLQSIEGLPVRASYKFRLATYESAGPGRPGTLVDLHEPVVREDSMAVIRTVKEDSIHISILKGNGQPHYLLEHVHFDDLSKLEVVEEQI